MRLALTCLLLSACSPALTIKRLSPPSAALGLGRTLSLTVSGKSEPFAGTTESVDQALHEAFAERVKALGYSVCPMAPCGDGALEVSLDQASLVDEEVKSESSPPRRHLSSDLEARITYTQSDGTVLYRRSLRASKQAVGEMPELAQLALRELAAAFAEQLSRQFPLTPVQLEGGGPLDAGLVLIHRFKWKDANAYFTNLTREQPELDGAWYDLGFTLEAQGDWPAALAAYREALKRAPKPHYERAATIASKVLTLD